MALNELNDAQFGFMLVKPKDQLANVLKDTIANNLSAMAEHHQKIGHEPDLDNIKVEHGQGG